MDEQARQKVRSERYWREVIALPCFALIFYPLITIKEHGAFVLDWSNVATTLITVGLWILIMRWVDTFRYRSTELRASGRRNWFRD
jgi:hypothetical protein